MRTPSTPAAVCLAALLLSGCDGGRSDRPTPAVAPAGVEAARPAPPVADTSVPAADTVMSPANATPRADAAAGRSNRTMSRAEESAAMPMPGQNNDHSAPLAATRRASSP